jgi:hypothetical protein
VDLASPSAVALLAPPPATDGDASLGLESKKVPSRLALSLDRCSDRSDGVRLTLDLEKLDDPDAVETTDRADDEKWL